MGTRGSFLARWRALAALGALALAVAACSDDAQPVVGGDTSVTDLGRDAADTGVAPDTNPRDTATPTDAMDAMDVPTGCRTNDDCRTDPAGAVCDTAAGRCVRCLASADTCPADQHCDPGTNACVAGCRNDEGCAAVAVDGGVPDGGVAPGRRCNVASHACVDCVTDEHCPAGMLCRGNTCVTGCTATRPCPTGQACCAGGCVDTQTNTDHCGACGAACTTTNGEPACAAGRCAVGRCTAPFGDCDMDPANGCETSTATTLAHCGACGSACPARANAALSCTSGVCAFTCNTGFADCDMDPANGCEVNLATTTAHCGRCGNACAVANGTAACAAGACAVGACNEGFGDCDANPANGCETDTRTTEAHCGRCGNACAAPANAAAACTAGACGLGACGAGYANCDANAANGCETDTRTTLAHCGACRRACGPANATGTCAAGACGVAMCNAGYADCDGNPANGCEVDTRVALAHCGMCGRACPTPPSGTATCVAGTCGIGRCDPGFGDCDMSPATGCEVRTSMDVAHCGSCGNRCATPANAAPICAEGLCGLGACDAGYANCNGGPSDGCEVDTRADVAHCGRCDNRCAFANGVAACTAGACALARCDEGFGDCDASAATGCEVDVRTSLAHCGACGARCAPANATPACAAGACGIAACAEGFGDCDRAPGNGCEVDVRASDAHCGACGRVCAAGTTCVAGTCQFGAGAADLAVAAGTVTINTVAASASASAGSATVTVSNVAGTFAPGQAVIVHQTQAATGPVGHYEFRRVVAVAGATLTLDAPLASAYTTSGTARAQVVVRPEYRDVAVGAGATLTAPAWNGNTGGILSFDAARAVTVAGAITMSGRGFRGRNHACTYRCGRGYQGEGHTGLGGVDIAANGSGGGGGGAGQDDGPPGGGGYGAAGQTGNTSGTYCGTCAERCPVPAGTGGAAVGPANLGAAVFLGGAGGEGGADEDGGNPGRGGNGGGVILVRAAALSVTGTITSNGDNGVAGSNAACGGGGCGMGHGAGGAGGAIRIQTRDAATLGASRITAQGGSSGASTCGRGRGGDGGVGRIGVRSGGATGTTLPTFDTN